MTSLSPIWDRGCSISLFSFNRDTICSFDFDTWYLALKTNKHVGTKHFKIRNPIKSKKKKKKKGDLKFYIIKVDKIDRKHILLGVNIKWDHLMLKWNRHIQVVWMRANELCWTINDSKWTEFKVERITSSIYFPNAIYIITYKIKWSQNIYIDLII